MSKPASFLVAAAARFEAEPTLELLESQGRQVEYIELGLGAIQAARRSGALVYRPNLFLFYVGTCGVFGGFKSPYLVTPSHLHFSDCAERLGLAYTISGQYPSYSLKPSTQPVIAALPRVEVVSSAAISLRPDLPFATKEPLVENLEIYGVAQDLAQWAAQGSLGVILGVTNRVGASAHEQWRAYHAAAAKQTAALIKESLRHENT